MRSRFISVILPVYNGEKYLTEAISSILSQNFKDFELLIVDDGSTDNSVGLIEKFQDNRIRLLRNVENKGLVFSLNLGIKRSVGKYIARMDCDDIADPDRLKIQYEYMESNPDVAVCGTFIRRFGSILRRGVLKLPVTNEEIKAVMLFDNPMAHPTVMIRKEIINRHNLKYKEEFRGAEDYGLWVEMMERSLQFANIPLPLLRYRVSDWSVSGNIFFNERKLEERFEIIDNIQKLVIRLILKGTEFDSEAHKQIYRNSFNVEYLEISKIRRISGWLKKLQKKNDFRKIFDSAVFDQVLRNIFYEICRRNSYLGISLVKELENFGNYSMIRKVLIIVMSITGYGYVELFLKKLYFRKNR